MSFQKCTHRSNMYLNTYCLLLVLLIWIWCILKRMSLRGWATSNTSKNETILVSLVVGDEKILDWFQYQMAFECFVSSCFLFNPHLRKAILYLFMKTRVLEFFLLLVFLFTFQNRNRVVYHQRKRRTEKLIKCKQRRGFFLSDAKRRDCFS